MSASFRTVGEKCIVCSIRNIYLLTKWCGNICFQFGCEHSRVTQTVYVSKRDIYIVVSLCILVAFGAGDSIISLIHNSDVGNGAFFRILFIIGGDFSVCLCVIIFLYQIKIAKISIRQLIDIINDSTLIIHDKHFSQRQLKIFECKSNILSFLLILFIASIILLYRLNGRDPNISYFQEISLYVICYYYLCYSNAIFMSVDLYCILMKTFRKCVKALVSDIIRSNNKVIVMYNIDKLRKISKLYLRIYFSFRQFNCYYNPITVIFMFSASFGFLLLVLSALFYAFEGKMDYFSITLILVNALFPVCLLHNAEILLRHVSNINIYFSFIYCYQECYSLLDTLDFKYLFR